MPTLVHKDFHFFNCYKSKNVTPLVLIGIYSNIKRVKIDQGKSDMAYFYCYYR